MNLYPATRDPENPGSLAVLMVPENGIVARP